jgi:23S rRNA pseudouridine1911/1915/1917 synthase
MMTSPGFSVVYQDHDVLAVNKDAGIVVHPTYKHTDGTLWDELLAYSQSQQDDGWRPPQLPDEPDWAGAPPAVREMLRDKRTARLWQEQGLLDRPCLLHRLDKDTSGLLLLARTERARAPLVKQFHEHSIEKRYLALVRPAAFAWSSPRAPFIVDRYTHGYANGEAVELDRLDPNVLFNATPNDEFVLDGALQRDPDERRRCIVGPLGQQAITRVRVLATSYPYALLMVQLVTGRTHQIRAHLATWGYAIVGDQLYAPAPTDPGAVLLARQFLHAYRFGFTHPISRKWCVLHAPLSADLENCLQDRFPTLYSAWLELANNTR